MLTFYYYIYIIIIENKDFYFYKLINAIRTNLNALSVKHYKSLKWLRIF